MSTLKFPHPLYSRGMPWAKAARFRARFRGACLRPGLVLQKQLSSRFPNFAGDLTVTVIRFRPLMVAEHDGLTEEY
jgi:hypothetical protein